MCGAFADAPALHHVVYRSQGGLNVVTNLVTVHWMYAPRCHELVHSQKGRFQQVLLDIASGRYGGSTTALQVLRWQRADEMKKKRRGG